MYIDKFIEHMAGNGISISGNILADGRWHRADFAGLKNNNKLVSYKLIEEADGAIGFYCYHREGVTYRFNARRSYAGMSPEKIAQRKKDAAEAKERYEAEIKRHHEKTAEKALRIWTAASTTGQTEYTKSKNINCEFARIYGNALIVPVLVDNKLVNLQFIQPDGSKRFMAGGRVNGCFCPLFDRDDSRTTILVCEGFATGRTLRSATGLPVIVAFNAGNIPLVVERLVERQPGSNIIICADNDQWTTNTKGHLTNVGLLAAESASRGREKVSVVYPPFDSQHPSRGTDFNDWAREHGVDSVRSLIFPRNTAVATTDGYDLSEREYYHEEPQLTQGEIDDLMVWKNRQTGVREHSVNNLIVALQHYRQYKGIFAYNQFSESTMLVRCPPWENPKIFSPRLVDDTDITALMAMMERDALKPGVDHLNRAVEAAALKNAFNPAIEYMESLRWDGVPRLDNWLIDIGKCTQDDPEYVRAVGRKFLTAAVARIFQPGTKFDYALILEGDEGLRKSTLLKELGTINGVSYYSDQLSVDQIKDKDTIGKIQGNIFLEFPEIGVMAHQMEMFKKWVTHQFDDGRPPYGRRTRRYLRKFIIAGTMNLLDGWLDDPTGGRRFWPVRVCSVVDIELMLSKLASGSTYKEQLWAEAVMRYKEGEKLYLDNRIMGLAITARESRRVTHPWHELVASKYGNLNGFVTDDVFQYLGIPKERWDAKTKRDIGRILRTLGFYDESKYCATLKRNKRQWVRKNDTAA